MKKKLLKHIFFIEVTVFFIVFFIFSFFNFLDSCKFLATPSIDNQILSTWKYTVINGLLPYGDIFYPYGIVSYFSHTNVLFSFIYLLITPILFSGIFIVLQKIWNNRLQAYTALIALFMFVYFYTGIEVFNRYGIIVGVALLLSYLLWKQIYLNKQTVAVVGVMNGFIFSLIPDQGIYALIVSTLFFLANPVIRHGIRELSKVEYYQKMFLSLLIFLSGACLGFLPIAAYLMQKGIAINFIAYLQNISDFAVFGKMPFIPYSASLENIFIYLSVIIGLFFLLSKTLLTKNRYSFTYYLTALLVVVLILLEQKSIVRSISNQIIFVSFLLFLIMAKEFDTYLKDKKIFWERYIFYLVFLIMIFTIQLQSSKSSYINFITFGEILRSKEVNTTLKNAYSVCLNNDIKMQTQVNSYYMKVVSHIKREPGHGMIFDYLHDPIFYILFDQKPPYYMTSYEATPISAQKANIEYIKKQNINYVLYNADPALFADSVPEYARTNELFTYILNNFVVHRKIGEFIVLKKNVTDDFFKNEVLNNIPELRDFLLNVNFAAIPKSEGLYKAHVLEKERSIVSTKDMRTINAYLQDHTVNSTNIFLVLTPENYKNNAKEMKVELATQEGLHTSVTFHRCSIGSSCIIHISNIPLFYKERVLKEILVDEAFNGKIELKESNEDKKLW